ncbi:MAG: antibiotic biosynthesis monooxygenase [Synergistaceae bacterium]|jgi:quinol monooxygenase YgiN|nr:antibiotic biosynthesis monooxygenase [Synergistaceae bacterium]
MIILNAKLTAAPGLEKDVESALRAMIPGVQNEDGCLEYTLYRDVKNPASFLYFERYKDQDALQTHQHTSHFQKLIKALDGKLANPTEETFYEVIDAIKR